jgi:mRNA interferase HigB
VREAQPSHTREDCSQSENILNGAVRIIAVSTLREFWRHPGRADAEQPLQASLAIVKAANWSKPTDIKAMFRIADVLTGGRVIFNIGGNQYRLVAAVHYRGKRIYVRFIGTHKDYEEIDARTV